MKLCWLATYAIVCKTAASIDTKGKARTLKLIINFSLTGVGWADCHVADETSSCNVTASYLSDALRHLVLAATAVLSGFRSVTFGFDEEPGE